eukprot:GHVN01023290.1.p1 GENE.GHVN01023290.1~~GHVN01023290.1.p1  ORF type:complete len:205 (+),score=39.16 GHVN01023290.1:223-837(+)
MGLESFTSTITLLTLVTTLTIPIEADFIWETDSTGEWLRWTTSQRRAGCGQFVDVPRRAEPSVCDETQLDELTRHWNSIANKWGKNYSSEPECLADGFGAAYCTRISQYVDGCTCSNQECTVNERREALNNTGTASDRDGCSEYFREWCGYEARLFDEQCVEHAVSFVNTIPGRLEGEEVHYEDCYPCGAHQLRLSCLISVDSR